MNNSLKEGEEICPRLLCGRKTDFQSDKASSSLVEDT